MSTKAWVLSAAAGVLAGTVSASPVEGGQAARRDERPAMVSARGAHVEEVTIKANSVIGIRLESTVSSDRAKVEDRVTARVTRDVIVDDRTAIPEGARLEGFVTVVESGGRLSGPPRIGLRFTTLLLDEGKTKLPMQTEPIFRSTEPPSEAAPSRIGAGALVGAVLGAVIGGKKGALIGGGAGAAAGAASAARERDRRDGLEVVSIPAGTALTVRLDKPFTLLVERQ
jgi:hypothetical protein